MKETITRKQFRDMLNKKYDDGNLYKNKVNGKVFGQRKRLYGDYLYFQDREKFEVYYKDFLSELPF